MPDPRQPRRSKTPKAAAPKQLTFDLAGAEFVFGVVAAVGTDTSGVKAALETTLKRFGYTPKVIRISDFLAEFDLGIPLSESSEYERINTRMNAGNAACRRAGRNDFLALAACAKISSDRTTQAGSERREPRSKTAQILMTLKRPEEVLALRRIYGTGFLLIGVFATEEERLHHLVKEVGMTQEQAEELIRRDRNEADPHGQGTRDTFHLADVFVRAAKDEYKDQLVRFVDLLFGHPFHTSTRDEHGMFLAFAGSLRSADLSRQVGAAILSERGEVIGIGCNDVPQAGGGLYGPDENDQRDHIIGYDTNEERRNEMVADIVARLLPNIPPAERVKEGLQLLKESPLLDITEFGRAVHAEMDAILAVARTGAGARGATLYSTTFPCHNCTRHIIAAGIKRVVYIEPYPKSKAQDLHADAISIEEQAHKAHATRLENRVSFESFVGVGPRRYADLFATTLASGKKIVRKEKGKRVAWTHVVATPRVPMLPTSYLEREQLASAQIEAMMHQLHHEEE